MGTSTHYGMTFPISPALSFEKTPRSQFLRSSATCAGCASRLRQELASSFLYVSSKQAASHGEDGCRGKPAPPTNVSGSSASVTFLALNWFAVLFGRTATSFRPSTKCAYRVESEAVQLGEDFLWTAIRQRIFGRIIENVPQHGPNLLSIDVQQNLRRYIGKANP